MRNPLCCGSVAELLQYRNQDPGHEWVATPAYNTNCSMCNKCLRKGSMYCSRKLISHLPRSATSHSMWPHLAYSFLPSQENLMPDRKNRVHLPKKGGRKLKMLSLTEVQQKAIMPMDSFERLFHMCAMMPFQWNKPVTQEVHFIYWPCSSDSKQHPHFSLPSLCYSKCLQTFLLFSIWRSWGYFLTLGSLNTNQAYFHIKKVSLKNLSPFLESKMLGGGGGGISNF